MHSERKYIFVKDQLLDRFELEMHANIHVKYIHNIKDIKYHNLKLSNIQDCFTSKIIKVKSTTKPEKKHINKISKISQRKKKYFIRNHRKSDLDRIFHQRAKTFKFFFCFTSGTTEVMG